MQRAQAQDLSECLSPLPQGRTWTRIWGSEGPRHPGTHSKPRTRSSVCKAHSYLSISETHPNYHLSHTHCADDLATQDPKRGHCSIYKEIHGDTGKSQSAQEALRRTVAGGGGSGKGSCCRGEMGAQGCATRREVNKAWAGRAASGSLPHTGLISEAAISGTSQPPRPGPCFLSPQAPLWILFPLLLTPPTQPSETHRTFPEPVQGRLNPFQSRDAAGGPYGGFGKFTFNVQPASDGDASQPWGPGGHLCQAQPTLRRGPGLGRGTGQMGGGSSVTLHGRV